jgi:hypothetical protein
LHGPGAFVAAYTSEGLFAWAKAIGAGPGSSVQSGDVATGGHGGVYLAGSFTSTATFESGQADEITLTSAGGFDMFVAKYTTISNTNVNDKVSFVVEGTSFSPMPVAGGPAGVFQIDAILTNTSSQTIMGPVHAIVNSLTGGNILLSVTEGSGSTGSRQRIDVGPDDIFAPGEWRLVQFRIGLSTPNRFTFLVDVDGVLPAP